MLKTVFISLILGTIATAQVANNEQLGARIIVNRDSAGAKITEEFSQEPFRMWRGDRVQRVLKFETSEIRVEIQNTDSELSLVYTDKRDGIPMEKRVPHGTDSVILGFQIASGGKAFKEYPLSGNPIKGNPILTLVSKRLVSKQNYVYVEEVVPLTRNSSGDIFFDTLSRPGFSGITFLQREELAARGFLVYKNISTCRQLITN